MLKDFPINMWEYKQLFLKDNHQSAKTETDLVKYGFRFTLLYLVSN